MRVIVLTGAGDKAFCAGADLQNSGAAFAMDFSRPNVDYADLLRLSQSATKPAIARVGGVCMAGGMGLLCMTDMAVAGDHVMFGLPEVKVGVFPMQVMALLQSIAPRRLVSEWSLTGEPFDAHDRAGRRAAELRCAGGRTRHQGRLAGRPHRRQVADRDPARKYAMRAIASMSFDESIAYTESQIALLAMTEDAKEGLKAFGEKRKPSWPGRRSSPEATARYSSRFIIGHFHVETNWPERWFHFVEDARLPERSEIARRFNLAVTDLTAAIGFGRYRSGSAGMTLFIVTGARPLDHSGQR